MVPFRVRRATVAKNEDYNYSVFKLVATKLWSKRTVLNHLRQKRRLTIHAWFSVFILTFYLSCSLSYGCNHAIFTVFSAPLDIYCAQSVGGRSDWMFNSAIDTEWCWFKTLDTKPIVEFYFTHPHIYCIQIQPICSHSIGGLLKMNVANGGLYLPFLQALSCSVVWSQNCDVTGSICSKLN